MKKNNYLIYLIVLNLLITIPLITIYIACKINLINYNLTGLASHADFYFLYYVWCLISFTTILLAFINLNRILVLKIKHLILLLTLALIISFLSPYHQGLHLSNLFHVGLGYFSFCLINYFLYLCHNRLFNQIKYFELIYLISLSVNMMLFMHYGNINGLMELIYTLSTCFILSCYLIFASNFSIFKTLLVRKTST